MINKDQQVSPNINKYQQISININNNQQIWTEDKRKKRKKTEPMGHLRAKSSHMLCAFTQKAQRHKAQPSPRNTEEEEERKEEKKEENWATRPSRDQIYHTTSTNINKYQWISTTINKNWQRPKNIIQHQQISTNINKY